MADIRSIEFKEKDALLNVTISKDEYDLLKSYTKNLIILPIGKQSLSKELTTGKLGNSNRIMLPKKILEKENIGEPEKKVPAQTFRVGEDVYLLIRLK